MSKVAEHIVFDIIDELTDRKGLLNEWFNLDESIKHEITGKLVGIVNHNIKHFAEQNRENEENENGS